MDDSDKTKDQLMDELAQARQRIAELEAAKADYEHMKAALLENEARWRTLVDTMPQGFGVRDANNKSTYANDAFCQMLGYDRDEIIGHDLTEFMDPESLAEMQRQLKHQKAGEPAIYELVWLGKDGRRVPTLISPGPILDADGHFKGSFAVITDITKLKATEAALRESEERYRVLFENVPIGISLSILDGDVLMVNRAMQDTLGYTKEELDLHDEGEIYKNPEERQQLIHQLETEGFVKDFEVLLEHKNGAEFSGSLTIIPFSTGTEEILVTMLSDITKRKEAEERNRQVILERERMRILSNFITQASHEFRTPLSIINTSVHLIKRLQDPMQKQRQITNIQTQVATLAELIQDLVTLSNLDFVRELEMGPVNPIALIHMLNDVMQPALREKHINIILELPEEEIQIQADEEYLTQAIQQIWDNAVQYTPEYGIITVCAFRKNDNLIIDIIDTGIGIEESELSRIFERFHRLDRAGTTRGFGLGLSIAKRIVELHQGRIEVESEPGLGSTFRIYLPASTAAAS